MNNDNLTLSQLESHLWEAANILRGLAGLSRACLEDNSRLTPSPAPVYNSPQPLITQSNTPRARITAPHRRGAKKGR
jgi:hypothetical protein